MLDWSCINGFSGIRGGYEFKEDHKKRKRKRRVKKELEDSFFHQPVYSVFNGNVLTSTTLSVTPIKRKFSDFNA
jgi:hypothetical protein